MIGSSVSAVGARGSTASEQVGACQRVWQTLIPAPLQAAKVMVVLSPRMVYAFKEWPRMRDVAKKDGFELVVRRDDPAVSDQEWNNAVRAARLLELIGVEKLNAQLAGRCGLLNHFPSTLVGRCGKAHP